MSTTELVVDFRVWPAGKPGKLKNALDAKASPLPLLSHEANIQPRRRQQNRRFGTLYFGVYQCLSKRANSLHVTGEH